jgi:membrane associated rhomboid family serine protease
MQYGNSFQRNTPVVQNLIIINALAFLATAVSGGLDAVNSKAFDLFALHHYKSEEFRIYQLITHMFMHGGFMHILFNMFALWMFGTMLERIWGPKRFLIFYLVCGLAAGLAQMGWYAYHYWPVDHMALNADLYDQYQMALRINATVGASGAVMGVLAAFGYLFPNTQLMIIPIPVPVKAKWAILGFIALDVFGAFAQSSSDNVAHLAHIGGAVVGFLIVFFWNQTNKRSFY